MKFSKKAYFSILICGVAIYVVLMAIFTFIDFKITSSLYKPGTHFGKIFEAIGPMFMPLFMIYSIVGLFVQLKFKRNSSKILSYIGLGFSYIYATFMGVMTHKHSYASWMFIPSIIIYVLFTVFVVILNFKFKTKEETYIKKHITILLVMFITCSISLMGVDIIKCIFGRLRYIEKKSADEFRYWFYINKFSFNSSFPSGHAARAMTAVCFSLLPLYWNKSKVSIVIQLIAIAFAVTVSISRLFEGMHYVTDIITGLFIVCVAFFVSKYKLKVCT